MGGYCLGVLLLCALFLRQWRPVGGVGCDIKFFRSPRSCLVVGTSGQWGYLRFPDIRRPVPLMP